MIAIGGARETAQRPHLETILPQQSRSRLVIDYHVLGAESVG